MEAIFNRHLSDFRNDFTLEFDVKIPIGIDIPDEDWEFENETGHFVNSYAKSCFDKIKALGYDWIKDWSFAGRSNGWFCLLCDNKEIEKIRPTQLGKIETIVEKFYKEYSKNLNNFYN